jgi:hypothetical protein
LVPYSRGGISIVLKNLLLLVLRVATFSHDQDPYRKSLSKARLYSLARLTAACSAICLLRMPLYAVCLRRRSANITRMTP